MTSLREYFPPHVWVLVLALAAVAGLGLFVPPSLTAQYGLSLTEHIVAIGSAKFVAAVGIGGLVVVYRDSDQDGDDDGEWRYDP